ncbi:hypothetical protein TNCT_224841 [Trichonephila clavata]|uniref:Uncharacterized protein n=1 Tax=Trichonephila clavata TaxID=2740835 RepID=A0A8X6KBK0_TRICU|nr:hypothetical protein TNCT_224841 [Trichonephila clavata]
MESIHRCPKVMLRCFQEREFRNVKKTRHAWSTWIGPTMEEHALRQEVRSGLFKRRSEMPYYPKEWAEGTVYIRMPS